jgi:hypothetical protein
MSESLAPLRTAVADLPVVRELLTHTHRTDELDVSLPPGLRAPVLSLLSSPVEDGAKGVAPLLVITATAREADDLAESLRCLLDDEPAGRSVVTYPSWETLPHERLSPRSDTVGRRLAVLRRLAHPDPDDAEHGPLAVVVAPVRAVLQPIAKGLGDLAPVASRAGDERPLEQVVEDLAAAAYVRTDLVERAASSRCAAASSTSSRRPRSTRCGWSSGATPSRRSAGSRSPTSAAWSVAEHGLWAPPCRELLLTDPCAPAPPGSPPSCPVSPTCSSRSPPGSPSRAWSPSRRPSSTAWRPSSTSSPRGTGGRQRPRAGPHPRPRPRLDQRGVPRGGLGQRRSGNAVPIDLQEVLGTAPTGPSARPASTP